LVFERLDIVTLSELIELRHLLVVELSVVIEL
jgi:hypothetical protein